MYIKLKPIEECKKIYGDLYGIGTYFWRNKGWIEVEQRQFDGKYNVVQKGLVPYTIPEEFVSAVFEEVKFDIDESNHKDKYEIELKPWNECYNIDTLLCCLPKELWNSDRIIVSFYSIDTSKVTKNKIQYFITVDNGYWIDDFYIPSHFIKSVKPHKKSTEPVEEKKPETESITFTKSGDTIKALWLKDGKVVNQSVAKCTKNDTFDMLKGTMVALGKLV